MSTHWSEPTEMLRALVKQRSGYPQLTLGLCLDSSKFCLGFWRAFWDFTSLFVWLKIVYLSLPFFLFKLRFSRAHTLFFYTPLHSAHSQAFKLFNIYSINCVLVQTRPARTRCDCIQCIQLQTCTQIRAHVHAATQISLCVHSSRGLCRMHDLTFR